MNTEDRDDLLMRYLDGAASPEHLAALEKLLLADPEARAFLRDIAVQAVSMANFGREATYELPIHGIQAPDRSLSRRWTYYLLATAAVVAVLFAMAFLRRLPEQEVVTLTEASGAISWSSEGGGWRTALGKGARLGPGTLSVEGGKSTAQVAFRDGTRVTLVGDSEATFSAGNQKSLVLRKGSLTADVRPQTQGAPLLVRTPTAEVRVLGTRFSLSHDQGLTTVSVTSGLVRLSRLADRANVELAAAQTASATLDVSSPLEAVKTSPAPSAWRQTFEQAPERIWQGEWLRPGLAEPGRLRNTLDISYRKPDGTVVPAHVIAVRENTGNLVGVQPESVLHLRLRTAMPVSVTVLVGLNQASGGFAGNFQADLPPQDLRPDETGWYDLRIPLRSLRPGMREYPAVPAAGRVFLVYLACYSADAGLELSEISITP